jgi:hypothetical protein
MSESDWDVESAATEDLHATDLEAIRRLTSAAFGDRFSEDDWVHLTDVDAPSPEGTLTLDAVDPRAVADDLFNRVVDAAATGDSAQLPAFLPLAVGAFGEAGPLDPDGLFHLATLLRIGERGEESLLTALAILDVDPDHLLGLGAAAEASRLAGRDAVSFYRRIMEVYDVQIQRPLDEYLGHASFTRVRADAEGWAEVP